MSVTKTQVRDFIVENFLFGEDDGLEDSTSFLEQGIIDSTGVLELILFLEQAFDIRVADEEVLPENLDSLVQVEAYVARKLAT